jgi:streptomycin 6-kinase
MSAVRSSFRGEAVSADESIPDVLQMLPCEVRANVLRVFGDRGRDWLDALPCVVAGLARRWELRFDARVYGGGTHSLVLAATRADGTPALLKVPVPDDENRLEAAALRAYAGDGAALLYAADPDTGALLMERLEPGTPLMDHPDRGAAIDVACGLLRRLRRPVPAGHPFHPVPDLVRHWKGVLPARQAGHGDLVPAREMSRILAAVESLLVPAGPELLVNRDAHLLNILAAEREPWLLIDPKPLAGEPAFDGGWLLIDVLHAEVTAANVRRLASRIGDGLGADPDRVRAWALVRSAENVFWDLDTGGDPAVSLALVAALA